MATKRKMEAVSSEISGYLHNISDVTTAAFSSTKYFHGTIQTEHDQFLRFVSFSPDKQSTMKSAETMKSPVKISDCVIKPKGKSNEVVLNKRSQITVTKQLDFSRSTTLDDPAKEMELASIEAANTLCSIRVKILALSTISQVDTRYGQREMQTAKIADASKSMTLKLWQQHTDKVKIDEYYRIRNVISSVYQGELQLSTTAKSLFLSTENFEVLADQDIPASKSIVTVGPVICCAVKAHFKCLNCKKNIDVDSTSIIIKCDNCMFKQKKHFQIKTLTIQISTENGFKKFVVFDNVLNAFLIERELQSLTHDEIENYFLSQAEIKVLHNCESDVVTEIDLTLGKNS